MPDRGDLPYIDLSGKFGIGCQDIDDTAQVMWPFPQLRGLIRILVKGRRPRMVRSGHNIALLGKLGRKPVQVAPVPSIAMRENHQRMGAGVGDCFFYGRSTLKNAVLANGYGICPIFSGVPDRNMERPGSVLVQLGLSKADTLGRISKRCDGQS